MLYVREGKAEVVSFDFGMKTCRSLGWSRGHSFQSWTSPHETSVCCNGIERVVSSDPGTVHML